MKSPWPLGSDSSLKVTWWAQGIGPGRGQGGSLQDCPSQVPSPRATGTPSHSPPPFQYLVDVPIYILVFGPDVSHVVLAVAETHLGGEDSGWCLLSPDPSSLQVWQQTLDKPVIPLGPQPLLQALPSLRYPPSGPSHPVQADPVPGAAGEHGFYAVPHHSLLWPHPLISHFQPHQRHIIPVGKLPGAGGNVREDPASVLGAESAQIS